MPLEAAGEVAARGAGLEERVQEGRTLIAITYETSRARVLIAERDAHVEGAVGFGFLERHVLAGGRAGEEEEAKEKGCLHEPPFWSFRQASRTSPLFSSPQYSVARVLAFSLISGASSVRR